MSNKHDFSQEALELRAAAMRLGRANLWDDFERLLPHDQEIWRALSKTALQYAKKVLAGQCIPLGPK